MALGWNGTSGLFGVWWFGPTGWFRVGPAGFPVVRMSEVHLTGAPEVRRPRKTSVQFTEYTDRLRTPYNMVMAIIVVNYRNTISY